MTYRVIDRGMVEHLDLRVLAVLALTPSEVSTKWGVAFDSVHDDLDTVRVLALEVDHTRFVLLRGDHEPGTGTNLLTPDDGDPVALTQKFVAAMGLLPHEVLMRWTGVDWMTLSGSAP